MRPNTIMLDTKIRQHEDTNVKIKYLIPSTAKACSRPLDQTLNEKCVQKVADLLIDSIRKDYANRYKNVVVVATGQFTHIILQAVLKITESDEFSDYPLSIKVSEAINSTENCLEYKTKIAQERQELIREFQKKGRTPGLISTKLLNWLEETFFHNKEFTNHWLIKGLGSYLKAVNSTAIATTLIRLIVSLSTLNPVGINPLNKLGIFMLKTPIIKVFAPLFTPGPLLPIIFIAGPLLIGAIYLVKKVCIWAYQYFTNSEKHDQENKALKIDNVALVNKLANRGVKVVIKQNSKAEPKQAQLASSFKGLTHKNIEVINQYGVRVEHNNDLTLQQNKKSNAQTLSTTPCSKSTRSYCLFSGCIQ